MSWITHVMVLDDDPRVLDSLVPSFPQELRRIVEATEPLASILRRGEAGRKPRPLGVKVSAHGYPSDRVSSYRTRTPYHLHLHLVREAGGRFDVARRLLNRQLFSVVVSDLRFSDSAGGLRAGSLFIDEVARIHPEAVGLLYSAYPPPAEFPSRRFVRKGGEASGEPSLASVVAQAMAEHFAQPPVAAFAAAVADQGLVYQSDAFGTTMAEVFALARLLGTEPPPAARPGGRARRPLPCILLDGESGTGKRGLAALFHAASERRKAPLVVASCNEITNETLLRSILFGHKRGAFTDAREDRAGLVATTGKGVLVLDDFHRLTPACSAIVHSFLEDGEYSRLGEEEVRRQAECAAVITVETGPWRERRRSGELPLAFLARVERLPVEIPPLRDRPDDIEAQARWLTETLSAELGVDIELSSSALARLLDLRFGESNSRELRNLIEQAVYRHYRETDTLEWSHLEPLVDLRTASTDTPSKGPTSRAAAPPGAEDRPSPALNEWQRRLRSLAARILERGSGLTPEEAEAQVATLFDQTLPQVWKTIESARASAAAPGSPPLPMPLWDDIWRCFAVHWLGGPTPAEKVLGIPANTLRQWINDRESRQT
jgi:hypothetical protein